MKKFRILACLLASLMLMPMVGCTVAGEKQTDPATEKKTEQKTESPATEPATEEKTEPETDKPVTETVPTLHNNGKDVGISIFWDPPMATVPPSESGEAAKKPMNFITDEQYDWIADAGITHIEITNRDGWQNDGAVEKILALSAARKLTVSLHTDQTENFPNMTDEEIAQYLKAYENHPEVSAVYLVDEPGNAASWARVYRAVLAANPNLTPKVNLLPHFASWIENYSGYVEDFIIAVGRDHVKELSYDQYPFPDHTDTIGDFYYNLNMFREIGLKYGVDTAFYIQSIGEGGSFRRTNANEIRFQVSAGLAYGIKNYKYFTWWTTGYCPEEYYAIISPYGEKTDLFDGVKGVNADVAKVGPILANLDAINVYHTRDGGQGAPKLPANSFIKQSDNKLFIYSFMQDRVDGRNYLMIVNKSYKKEVTETFTVKGINAAYNCTDGTYQALDLSSGKMTFTFAPGGFVLIALGDRDVICNRVYDEDSTNLAYKKPVAASETEAGGGFYASCVADGKNDSKLSTAMGWQMKGETGWIEIDLEREVEINRVDLYATRTGFSLGTLFPTAFRVLVSTDGEHYTAVVTKADYDGALTAVPSFTFREVKARYVRVEITGKNGEKAEIAEIRIFNDQGKVPAPDQSLYDEKKQQAEAGGNAAKGMLVTVSSSYNHPEWGWCTDNLTDGDNKQNGWASMAGAHRTDPNAEEWLCVDLQKSTAIHRIVLYPRQDNGTAFPKSYDILISDDGENWTLVKHIDDPDAGSHSKAPRTITMEGDVSARYVKILSREMTQPDSGASDGFMFMLCEIEIYKK